MDSDDPDDRARGDGGAQHVGPVKGPAHALQCFSGNNQKGLGLAGKGEATRDSRVAAACNALHW